MEENISVDARDMKFYLFVNNMPQILKDSFSDESELFRLLALECYVGSVYSGNSKELRISFQTPVNTANIMRTFIDIWAKKYTSEGVEFIHVFYNDNDIEYVNMYKTIAGPRSFFVSYTHTPGERIGLTISFLADIHQSAKINTNALNLMANIEDREIMKNKINATVTSLLTKRAEEFKTWMST